MIIWLNEMLSGWVAYIVFLGFQLASYSLQDDMFEKYSVDVEWAMNLASKLASEDAIEDSVILRQLLSFQMNVEKFYFGMRKRLVEFDEVLEIQRKHVYGLRELILAGDSESCSENICQYMQAVVDEIIFRHVDPGKDPGNWNLWKILDDFNGVARPVLPETFSGVTREVLLSSLYLTPKGSSSLQNLPPPPDEFRGIRRKVSSLKRWSRIINDDTFSNGKYRQTANLLRKYLGDLLITSYHEVVEDSGFDGAYVQEIERTVLINALDSFWKDHLVNMNRLHSTANVRSFGHRDPLEEYKIDGCRFFISMLSAIRRVTIESLLQYWTSRRENEEELYVN